MGYNYPYEVHSIASSGRDVLHGGSKTLEGAEDILMNQIEELITNPWEEKIDIARRVDSFYIYNTDKGGVVETAKTDDFIDTTLSEFIYKHKLDINKI